MPGKDIAIDFGTSYVKIYLDGQGIIVNEPSVAAVSADSGEVLAMGEKAYKMIGRTSDKINICHPITFGVISDFDLASYIMKVYLKKIKESKVVMPRAVVSTPCEITEVGKRAFVDTISSSGVRKICLIKEPVAAALGAGVDISAPHGTLVVDIGGGTTDMAVLSLSGMAISRSVQVAGNSFDESIIKYIRRKYNLIIGQHMAEAAKISIGCVFPREDVATFRVKGRNAMTGLPQWADISSDEILEAIIENAMQIIRVIQEMLEKTPPELVGDVYSDGLILTGGSAQIYGFDRLISKKVKMPVHIAEDPQNCVALGAGKAIRFIDDMENKSYGVINPLSDLY